MGKKKRFLFSVPIFPRIRFHMTLLSLCWGKREVAAIYLRKVSSAPIRMRNIIFIFISTFLFTYGYRGCAKRGLGQFSSLVLFSVFLITYFVCLRYHFRCCWFAIDGVFSEPYNPCSSIAYFLEWRLWKICLTGCHYWP